MAAPVRSRPRIAFHDLGPDFYDTHTDPERKKRNHVRQVDAIGYKTPSNPPPEPSARFAGLDISVSAPTRSFGSPWWRAQEGAAVCSDGEHRLALWICRVVPAPECRRLTG